jgi:putative PEP-CTERM system TPR-repeat lipoprotein
MSGAAALAILLPILGIGIAAHAADQQTYRNALDTARQTMAKGDLKRAEIEMRNATKTYPNNPDVHALLGEILLKLGDSPGAEEEARLARWHNGNDDEIAPVLAEAMLEQDKMSELIKDVPPGSRDMKVEATVRRALAEAHIALGDVAVGETLLEDSRRLDPNSQETHVSIARLHLVEGDIPGAEQELAAALKIEPNAIDVLRLEADIMRAKGNLAGALAALGKAIGQHPDDLSLLSNRAMILISQNRLDDAKRDVDHALDLAPYSLTPNFLSGVLLARKGELKPADDALTGISASFDSLPNGYYLLGAVKYAEGQYDSAIFYLAQYVARRPDDLPARLLLAESALKKGDPVRAVQVLSPAVYVKTPDPRAISLMEQADVAAGRKDEALSLFAQEAGAKPSDPRLAATSAMAQLGLGEAMAGTAALGKLVETDSGIKEAGPAYILDELNYGRLGNAEAAAQRLVAAERNNPVALLMLSFVRMAQLRYDDAEPILHEILGRNPTFVPAQYNLAQLYRDTGRDAEARAIYEKLLLTQPGDQTSLRSLAEIAAAQGNHAEATRWLQKAQAAAPRDSTPTIRIVEIDSAAKDWRDAIAAAHQLVDQFSDPQMVQLLAATLANSGDLVAATAAYGEWLDHHDGTVTIYRGLAAYQHKAGKLDDARKSLQAGLAVAPNDEGAMADLVDLDYETAGAEDAIDTARSFSVRDPEMSDLLAANVLERAGRREEAIALLRQSQVYRPSTRNAGRLAELVWESGKHDDAKAMLRAVLAKHNDMATRLALANMDMLDGDGDEAIALYQQVLAATPNEVLALNNLASLYEARNDPRSFELALQAFRLAPSPDTADTLGWALVRVGDTAKALPFLERAATAKPEELVVQYHFAVALQGSGALDRARSLLERIVAAKASFTGKDDAERRLEALQRG